MNTNNTNNLRQAIKNKYNPKFIADFIIKYIQDSTEQTELQHAKNSDTNLYIISNQQDFFEDISIAIYFDNINMRKIKRIDVSTEIFQEWLSIIPQTDFEQKLTISILNALQSKWQNQIQQKTPFIANLLKDILDYTKRQNNIIQK